jgi:chemotaxis protein CheZ
MAEPRKVFRIERTAAVRPRTVDAPPSPAATTDAVARGERQWLGIEAEHLTRIAHELEAVTIGTDQATQKILAAAEAIDQLANNLAAALKGKIEQDSAQDISDLVIRIFEACNFQDLIGQRVTKVMAILKILEAHVARVLDEIKNPQPALAGGIGADYLHGPRLDIDRGHVSQNDIDTLFD